MVTSSPRMHECCRLIQRIAPTDVPILIRGETGTGKELVARAIHALSRRASGPFRAVNCATLTPELLASELFGHVKGAFTGAIRSRQGLFSLADGGTLFLDEIAEIPLDIQARLLRVLEEQVFVPVGGTERIRVDVRVLSATHRALRREVDAGRFRRDLMHRIRVVPIFLPRLADRGGDVELLSWHFIREFNALGLRRIEAIDPRCLAAMRAYPWPGNVRELRNVIQYAFAVGEGPLLSLSELTPELRGEPPPGESGPESPRRGRARAAAPGVVETWQDRERAQILDALERVGGNRSRAAEALGMHRATLWRKMKALGL